MVTNFNNIIDSLWKESLAHLENLWISQLTKECEIILYNYKIKLKPPILALSDNLQTLGTWDAASRTIAISKKLITDYNWNIVVSILKHEMAHQLVSEYFHGNENHSILFKQACELIYVPPEFRKARISIDDARYNWKEHKPCDTQAAQLRKVERLLSLAKSDNEHEAYLAMEKAQELIKLYNISLEQKSTIDNFVKNTIELYKHKIDRPTTIICGILSEFYFVRIIYSNLYNAKYGESYKTIEILGSKENVLIAEYVFHFLLQTIESLWNTYKKQNGLHGASQKLSYQIGLLSGFKTKLKKHEACEPKTSVSASAIIKHEKALLDEFTDLEFPRLSTKRISNLKVESSSYQAGCAQGKQIVINKGVGNSGAPARLLR